MSTTTETPSAATAAGAEAKLSELDRIADTGAARATLALSERAAALRLPFIVANGEESDMPEAVVETMRIRREARLNGAAKLVCADVKSGLTAVMTELRALGAMHGKDRYIREATLSPEARDARSALEHASTAELIQHVNEAVSRRAAIPAIVAVHELQKRPDVPLGTAREAEALLANLEFPVRAKLLERAEAVRAKIARTLLDVADITAGPNDAAAEKLSVIRAHLPPQQQANGQLDRPEPPSIWAA